jgi:hypothetical protein
MIRSKGRMEILKESKKDRGDQVQDGDGRKV